MDIKSGVVYEWLAGTPRDKIAEIYNISTEGVTNIINEWRIKISGYIADDSERIIIIIKKAKTYTASMFLWDSKLPRL